MFATPQNKTKLFEDTGDWRTLLLAMFCHLAFISLLFDWFELPLWLSILCLVPLITLYSSLSHEIIHGHPFRFQWLNDLLVLVPYGLIVPYYRFKDTHLAHHNDVNICDPYEDPESWYQATEIWEQRSSFSQAVFNFNNTLVGRMLLGPLIGMTGLVKCDFKRVLNGDFNIAGKWVLHIGTTIILLLVVRYYGGIPLWGFWLAAYAGMSLLMVRTFLEHQAHEKVRGRSVIIENSRIFGFLFLNNSFHAVHHVYPSYSWYRLPKLFRENRTRFLAMNDDYSFSNYFEIFRQFSFKAKEPVPLPEKMALKK
ncbi:MAG: fatty acid desaturase [Salaquimonas sp.]